jgi:hypothetical protein
VPEPPAPFGSEPAPPLVVEPAVVEVDPVVADVEPVVADVEPVIVDVEPVVADVELEELVVALPPVPATVAPWEPLVVLGANRSLVFAWPQLTLNTIVPVKKAARRMVGPLEWLPNFGSSSARGRRLPGKRAGRADGTMTMRSHEIISGMSSRTR